MRGGCLIIRCAQKLALILAGGLLLCLALQLQNTYQFPQKTTSSGYDLRSTSDPDAAATTLTTSAVKQKRGIGIVFTKISSADNTNSNPSNSNSPQTGNAAITIGLVSKAVYGHVITQFDTQLCDPNIAEIIPSDSIRRVKCTMRGRS